MRFIHTAAALLISTGSVLAWTADVRAQCSNYATSTPNHGNWQAQLGSNSCAPLTNVQVTVAITQDIVVATTSGGCGANNGFSMQLNANGPSSGLTSSQNDWTQFVIQANTENMGASAGVSAFTQQWESGKPAASIPNNPQLMGNPGIVNSAGFVDIPAGTTFNWVLFTDNNNVTHCNYTGMQLDTYSGPNGTYEYYYKAVGNETIPDGDQAPIVSLEMEIVGYTCGSFTTFQSGAGTITYSGANLSSSYDYPSCSANSSTAENSNMVYGPLVENNDGTFTQTFSVPAARTFTNAPINPDGNTQWCLDVEGGVPFNGAKIDMYPCNQQSNQEWTLNCDGTITSGLGSNWCLDLPDWDTNTDPPPQLDLWTCNGGTNQMWTYEFDNTIRGYGGGCVNLAGADLTGTQPIIYWPCSSSEPWNQLWTAP